MRLVYHTFTVITSLPFPLTQALGYNNQAGVGEAVRQLGRDKLFVTTKVPPCKATDTVAECSESTSTAVNESIAELGIGKSSSCRR